MQPIAPAPADPFDDLVRDHRRALVAVARREGMSAEEALECVQEALVTFLSRADAGPIDDAERVVATLRVMVRNVARNARRKHARAKTHDAVDDETLSVDAAGADLLFVHAEDVARLHVCVAGLSDVQRAVVTLRLLDERSGEDVAAVLGLSRGYVDVLVHRAKAALSDCMS